MKSFTHDQGGWNEAFYWSYIHRYLTNERIIWVCGSNEFVNAQRAVIDDFGNLVGVK